MTVAGPVVTRAGTLTCRDEDEIRILRTWLPDHVRRTRAEPGCLFFDVAPTDDPHVWRVVERFTDQAAFASHQARMRASRWGAETAAIRRDYTIEETPP